MPGCLLARVGAQLQLSRLRRESEQAIRKNQEIFKLVHSIGKIGHWEWNAQTGENKWPPEIEALYGLKQGTFEGTYEAWTKLLHPDDLTEAEEDVRRAMETGKYFTEFRVVWPDGSVHWLEARANVFKDDHGKPRRFMGVNMDITERKRIEEALKEADRAKTNSWQRWPTSFVIRSHRSVTPSNSCGTRAVMTAVIETVPQHDGAAASTHGPAD